MSEKSWCLEQLGVEAGEVFSIEQYSKNCLFKAIEDGRIMAQERRNEEWCFAGLHLQIDILNNPHVIIRTPRVTDEQRKVLEALQVLGVEWVAMDEDGDIYGYEKEPVNEGGLWDSGFNNPYICSDGNSYAYRALLHLLPDWTVALDVRRVLGVSEA